MVLRLNMSNRLLFANPWSFMSGFVDIFTLDCVNEGERKGI